jgi:hypothetical protein
VTIPDPLAAIIALLLDDDAVTALADGRVFGGELPEEHNAAMPQPAVVVSPAGGPGRPGTIKYRRNRIDTICYGATLLQSWQLHLAVREALETMGRDGAVFTASISSDGANARDPVKQWPTCYASYSVLSATEA